MHSCYHVLRFTLCPLLRLSDLGPPEMRQVRTVGILLSLALSSWLLRENLVALVAAQLSSLAERFRVATNA